MRILCFILAALMALFAAVQYNDPDGAQWMVVYGIPAGLALLAATRPQWYDSVLLRGFLVIGGLAAIAGMVHYWPKSERWWAKDVWWEVETAREGMGMMITVIVLGLIYMAQHLLRKRLAVTNG